MRYVTKTLNILELEWRYCKPFSNAAVPIKFVAMATSLGESEKEFQIVHTYANTYYLVKMVKIDPVDPKIIVLKFKKNN